jgi:hypothetical protein
MSLITEDGTGLANAESYASVADATAYHAARGNAAWAAASLGNQEIALRQATDYLERRYVYRGTRKTIVQALLWPRVGVYVDYINLTWPVTKLTQATCELALRALSGPLVNDQTAPNVKREKIGPLETEYFGNSMNGQTFFTTVDDLLAPLIKYNTRDIMRVGVG